MSPLVSIFIILFFFILSCRCPQRSWKSPMVNNPSQTTWQSVGAVSVLSRFLRGVFPYQCCSLSPHTHRKTRGRLEEVITQTLVALQKLLCGSGAADCFFDVCFATMKVWDCKSYKKLPKWLRERQIQQECVLSFYACSCCFFFALLHGIFYFIFKKCYTQWAPSLCSGVFTNAEMN